MYSDQTKIRTHSEFLRGEDSMSELEERTLPAGTVVKINGIPLFLVEDAKLQTHPNNWALALEESETEADSE